MTEARGLDMRRFALPGIGTRKDFEAEKKVLDPAHVRAVERVATKGGRVGRVDVIRLDRGFVGKRDGVDTAVGLGNDLSTLDQQLTGSSADGAIPTETRAHLLLRDQDSGRLSSVRLNKPTGEPAGIPTPEAFHQPQEFDIMTPAPRELQPVGAVAGARSSTTEAPSPTGATS